MSCDQAIAAKLQRRNLLAHTLRHPESINQLTPKGWQTLIGQARAAALLGQLRNVLDQFDLLESVPARARGHLDTAWAMSKRHEEAVHWELRAILRTLKPLAIPVVVLKGAAYSAAGLRAAQGRVFNDVDILVPREALDSVERTMIANGWLPTHLSAYDQHYYRRWMHELPPLEHKNRGTVLDIHHAIVPPTSGVRPDSNRMIADARSPTGSAPPGLAILAPEDMVLHSACHLYYGEFDKGLRDLFDIHRLLLEFGPLPNFWNRLAERARELGLTAPLAFALEFDAAILGGCAPAGSEARQVGAAHRRASLATRMFFHALRPRHDSCADLRQQMATAAVYVRSHWLRMPPHLLLPHLFRKAFLTPKDA